jgi:adenylate kinase family enzyme
MKNPVNNEKYLKEQDNKHSRGTSNMNSSTSLILPPINKSGSFISNINNRSSNKFENFKAIHENKIIEDIQNEEEYFNKEKEENNDKIHDAERQFHLDNLKKDKVGQQQWEANMGKRDEWLSKQKELDNKEAIYYKNATINTFVKSAEENRKQIEHFDKNLSRLGLDVVSIDPKLKRVVANISGEMILQKIREKVTQNEAAVKDKEKRQRKIAVEQFKAQTKINYQKTLKQFASSDDGYMKSILERRQEYDNWRSLHEKDRLHEAKKTKIPVNPTEFDFDCRPKPFDREEFLKTLNKQNLKVRKLFLEEKKTKREKNYNIVSGVIDLICSLTEEVFDYQNKNKVELVEVNDWREMAQRFINGEHYVPSVNKELFEYDQDMIVEDEHIDINNYPAEDLEFADIEIFDYVNYIGQWEVKEKLSKNIILKIQDVITMENEPLGAVNPYSDYYEPTNEELEALTIPKDNSKTYIFGDILDIALELKYSEIGLQGSKNILAHIPIKLSLIGHVFAGKKTQAKLITDANPGVKVYNLDDLVKKAIETMDKLDTPIEAHPKFKTFKKNQIDQMITEKANEEAKFTEMRKIITVLKNDKTNNELLVNLLLEYIRQDFPEKKSETIIEEILLKHKRRKEIAEELAKIKEEQIKKPKVKVKEEQLLNNELNKLNNCVNIGFIVLDFPSNIEQARILENKLTGYIQEIEKPTTPATHFKEMYSQIIDKISKPPKAKAIKLSGIDFAVVVNVQGKECIRRATGRKLDPNTGIIYHMQDNPPPENDKRLNERLQLIDVNITELENANSEFDFGFNRLCAFYDSFGYPRYNYRFLNIVQADGLAKDKVNVAIVEYIHKINKMIEDKENEIILSANPSEGLVPLRTFTNMGVNNTLKVPESNNKELHTISSTSNFLKDEKKESVPIINIIKESPNHTQSNFYQPIATGEHFNDNMSYIQDDDEHKFLKRVEETRKKFVNVENILSKWNLQYLNYTNELKIIFLLTKKQKITVNTNLSNIQVNYIKYLQRPSKKMTEVLKFQNKYNQFYEEYPELISDLEIREQFHQDIDDLTERIWDQIELRKTEAIDERNKIMSTGWLENEMTKFFNYFERLLITEIEKLITTLNLILEYFLSMDGKPIYEINPLNFLKLLKNYETLPFETSSGAFPRIEKIFKNCVRIIFKIDELYKDKLNRQNTVSESSNTSVGKRTKMAHMKRHITEITMMDDKNILLYEEEMKTALKAEKIKFKFRITLLKQWAIENLSNMRKSANVVYEQLDEWIIQTIKMENDSMNSLIEKLRDDVDKELKVKGINDFELDSFNFYEKIEINLLGAVLVNTDEDYFNLNTFLKLFDELKQYEVQKNYIKSRSFVDIYIKKHLLENNEGISRAMRKVSYHNLHAFIKGLEFIYKSEIDFPNE